MSLTRISKRSSSIAFRACSPLVATRNGYDSISRIEPISFQMERSSSTTKTLGFALLIPQILIRYPQCEYRTLSYFTLDRHVASVPCRDFFDKCQTEAEPALFAGFFIAAAVK